MIGLKAGEGVVAVESRTDLVLKYDVRKLTGRRRNRECAGDVERVQA